MEHSNHFHLLLTRREVNRIKRLDVGNLIFDRQVTKPGHTDGVKPEIQYAQ